MSSFSGGILVGFLNNSVTEASKFCSLCKHGWSWSSSIPHNVCCSWECTPASWGLHLFPNSFFAPFTSKNLPNPGSIRNIHANNLTMKWTIKFATWGMNFSWSLRVTLLVWSVTNTKSGTCQSLNAEAYLLSY